MMDDQLPSPPRSTPASRQSRETSGIPRHESTLIRQTGPHSSDSFHQPLHPTATRFPQNPYSNPPSKRKMNHDSPQDLPGHQSKRGGGGRRVKNHGHNLANMASLGSSGIFDRVQDSTGHRDSRVDPDLTQRRQVLSQLFRNKDVTDVRSEQFDEACQAFGKHTQNVKPVTDDNGEVGWLVNTMQTPLKHHQLLAAGRMRRLEKRDKGPKGGILADAMGLGKTIEMLANLTGGILDARKAGSPRPKATLVVVKNRQLMKQWNEEIRKHCSPDGIRMAWEYTQTTTSYDELARRACENDVIITTYADVRNSWPKSDMDEDNFENLDLDQIHQLEANAARRAAELGPLHRIFWGRIVLDEAHYIKKDTVRTSLACRGLKSTYAWAMTGTPIHNTYLEAFSYLDLLHHPGTSDRRHFIRKYKDDQEELGRVFQASMIRRNYATTLFNKCIVYLPPSERLTPPVVLQGMEKKFNLKITNWVRNAIAAVEEEEEDEDKRMKRVMAIIIRARQMSSHFFLVAHLLPCFGTDNELREMIREQAIVRPTERQIGNSLTYLNDLYRTARGQVEKILKKRKGDAYQERDVINHLLARVGEAQERSAAEAEAPSARELEEQAAEKPLNIKTFDFQDYEKAGGVLCHSGKTREIMTHVDAAVRRDPSRKIIIFSFFLTTLNIFQKLCEQRKLKTCMMTGKVKAETRTKRITEWSENPTVRVLLSTVQCGAEGLNLTAGQDVFMAEPWWNTALQEQAFGRVFRIGQTKETTLKLYVVLGSWEQRMYTTQLRKDREIEPIMGKEKRLVAEVLETWDDDAFNEATTIVEDNHDYLDKRPMFAGAAHDNGLPLEEEDDEGLDDDEEVDTGHVDRVDYPENKLFHEGFDGDFQDIDDLPADDSRGSANVWHSQEPYLSPIMSRTSGIGQSTRDPVLIQDGDDPNVADDIKKEESPDAKDLVALPPSPTIKIEDDEPSVGDCAEDPIDLSSSFGRLRRICSKRITVYVIDD